MEDGKSPSSRAGGGKEGKNGRGKGNILPSYSSHSSILLAALLPPEPDDDDGFQIIVRVTCYMCPYRRMYTVSIFASILHSQDYDILEVTDDYQIKCISMEM